MIAVSLNSEPANDPDASPPSPFVLPDTEFLPGTTAANERLRIESSVTAQSTDAPESPEQSAQVPEPNVITQWFTEMYERAQALAGEWAATVPPIFQGNLARESWLFECAA